MKVDRLILGLAALEICGVGLVYLIAPRLMLAANGMAGSGVSDLHAARAAYGGLFVAFGLTFGLAALKLIPVRFGLGALVIFMGGFAIGRIVSILADGMPPGAFLGALASEVVLGAIAAWLLMRPSNRPR